MSPAVAQLVRAGRAVSHAGGAVRWYVRELMGDTAYERYLARFAVEHGDRPDHAPLSEKEFWRHRIDDQPLDARCC